VKWGALEAHGRDLSGRRRRAISPMRGTAPKTYMHNRNIKGTDKPLLQVKKGKVYGPLKGRKKKGQCNRGGTGCKKKLWRRKGVSRNILLVRRRDGGKWCHERPWAGGCIQSENNGKGGKSKGYYEING